MGTIVNDIDTNFTSGELDPKMNVRIDTKQYFNGAAKLRNVLPIPKGGVRRRPGMEYIADRRKPGFPNTDKVRYVWYKDILTNDNYLLVLTDDFIDVYLNDALVTSINPAIAGVDIPLVSFTQEDDNLIFFAEGMQPKFVTNIGGWTIDDWALENIPTVQFTDTVGGGVDHVEDIHFLSFNSGDRFTLFLNGHETDPITYSAVDATLQANLDAGISALSNVDSTAGAVVVTHNTGNKFIISMLLNNGDKFWDFSVGTESFDDPANNSVILLLTDVKGKTLNEPVWSATRGWPRAGVFRQGRLLMAGSSQVPLGVWGSRPTNPHDFDTERDDDDFGFSIVADSGQSNVIHSMIIGSEHVQLFGTEAEYYIPTPLNAILTPTNVTVRRATKLGSVQEAGLVQAFGSTIFLQKGGKVLQEFIFNDSKQAYESNPLSEISSHLLSDIGAEDSSTGPFVSMAYRKATSTDEAHYIFISPGATLDTGKGIVLAYSFLPGEGISAWSRLETRGEIQEIAVVGDDVYFATRRYAASPANDRLIEKYNDDLLFDAGVIHDVSPGPDTQTTAMTWLAFSPPPSPPRSNLVIVEAMVDGSLDAVENFEVTANSTGVLVFNVPALVQWQAGLRFPIVDEIDAQVWIKLMPFESESIGVPLMGKLKRVVEVNLSLFETSHVVLNRTEVITFREFETSVLDSGVEVKTGRVRIEGLLGYDREQQTELTQTESLPLTLLGLTQKVRL